MKLKDYKKRENISEDANKHIWSILKDFQKFKSKSGNEMPFSCDNDAKRFNKFNINTLPLIKVPKYLKITVEKSNTITDLGMFNHKENRIILGSDYAPVFLHELSHAIDYILGNSYEEHYLDHKKNFDELVAELSTLILCRTYNIPVNLESIMYYLDTFCSKETNLNDIIKRVALIYEYIVKRIGG